MTWAGPLAKPRPRVLDKRAIKLAAERQWREAVQVVRKRDKGRCRVCRKPGTQAHHLVYRSHGGRDEPRNLILTCAECHRLIHAHVVTVTFDAQHPARTVRFARNTQWD